VTGGGAGIGQGIAQRLAREGASVVVADIDEAAARSTAEALARSTYVRADVANEDDVANMIAVAEANFGGLDILVNNAGIVVGGPNFPDAPVADWLRVIDVNLRGVLFGLHYGVAALRRRGGGVIVNIASMAGVGYDTHVAPEYAASKAGVARVTGALGNLAAENIRVNCICPGWVDTPMSRRTRDTMTAAEIAALPVLLTPDDIADAVMRFVDDPALAGCVLSVPDDGEKPYFVNGAA